MAQHAPCLHVSLSLRHTLVAEQRRPQERGDPSSVPFTSSRTGSKLETATLPCLGKIVPPLFLGACLGHLGCRHQRLRVKLDVGIFCRERPVPVHRAAPRVAVAGRAVPSSKETMPNYEKYTDGLIMVIRQAEEQAKQFKQGQLGTDSLLLGLLAVPDAEAPGAEAMRGATFPGVDVSAVISLVTQRLGSSKGGRKVASNVPMAFTPMARRALAMAEEEQKLLDHEAVEPAHLLLALLKDERGESRALLARFDQDHEAVRRRLLQTLSGPLARIRFAASQQLLELRNAAARQASPMAESSLTKKLSRATDMLKEGLVERSVEAKLLLLAALSGEHLFLLGPPGTAKSLLARRLAGVCRGFFFERLLTRFSVPEEVFGPLSLRALENDELRRKVDGFLPSADVAFLDEVFKANSSILNALLALLNERIFDNGGERMQVPLWCAVAASNELPESDELEALFDRFLLRRAVPRVSDAQVPNFLRSSLDANAASSEYTQDEEALLSAEISGQVQAAAESTHFPDRLLQLVVDLRAYLRDEAEPPVQLSDRRLGKAVRLIRLAAHAVGATEVSELDLLILQHVCWDKDPAQADEVRDWLMQRMGENLGTSAREKDTVDQARYFLNGVRTRLRRRPRKQVTLATARRDLEAIQEPLQDQLRTRLERQAQLQEIISQKGLRTFWLEPADLEDAELTLMPSVNNDVEEAEKALTEVLELQAALDIQGEAREACLDALLADFIEETAAKASRSGEDLNRWASNFRLDDV